MIISFFIVSDFIDDCNKDFLYDNINDIDAIYNQECNYYLWFLIIKNILKYFN